MYSLDELIKVSKMYYELNYTQKQIAEKLNYSRPTISRMLEAAIERGVIKITIQYSPSSVTELELQMKEKFGLKNVVVSKSFVENDELIKDDVGKYLAEYLTKILKPSDILGISWGTTLSYVTNHLKKHDIDDIKVIQLNGGISKNTFSTGSIALLERFSYAFSAEFHLLPLPPIVDSKDIANAIVQDTITKGIIDLGNKANIALFGIGQASKDNVLYKGGYFSEEEFDHLLNQGAVGDICSRYFDIDGNLVDVSLNERTIGLQLDDLQKKEYSIGIAIGKEKMKAVYGAIKGGYLNTLFIDDRLATSLLQFEEEKKNASSKII